MPDLLLLASDDLAALEQRRDVVTAARDAALEAMAAADTGSRMDWPAYDRAAAVFDPLDDELALLDRRIWELEEDAGYAAMREEHRAYWRAVL